jgi:hypothetical protein
MVRLPDAVSAVPRSFVPMCEVSAALRFEATHTAVGSSLLEPRSTARLGIRIRRGWLRSTSEDKRERAANRATKFRELIEVPPDSGGSPARSARFKRHGADGGTATRFFPRRRFSASPSSRYSRNTSL